MQKYYSQFAFYDGYNLIVVDIGVGVLIERGSPMTKRMWTAEAEPHQLVTLQV